MGLSLANLSKDNRDNKKAIELQKEAIDYLLISKGSDNEIAQILINIGLKFTIPDSATTYYMKALKYAKNGNLPRIEIGAYNNMAYSYLDANNIPEAESSILHAIHIAKETKDDDWLSTLYDSYSDILIAKEDFREAVTWQKKAIKETEIAAKEQASKQVRLL